VTESAKHPCRVLVVAPGRKTRGGITAVVKAYEDSAFWQTWNCHWIETYRDGNSLMKVGYFLRGLIVYLFCLPQYSIVHIHLSEPTSAFRKSFFFYLAHWLRKKVILHFHAFSPESTLNGPKKRLYQNMFARADAIIVLSEYWKDQVAQCVPNTTGTIRVISNPCPEIRLSVRLPLKKSSNFILYAGTVNKRKGYVDLVEAFSLLASRYPDWNLVLAGNGEIECGRALAKILNIENRVAFLGWISDEEKEHVFRQATIFCLPSYNEGLPMALLDACAYGLPIIATPVGGIPDVFRDGKNAVLVPPGDVHFLSEKIELLIRDETLREQLGVESYLLSQNSLSVATVTQQLCMLNDDLLHGKQ